MRSFTDAKPIQHLRVQMEDELNGTKMLMRANLVKMRENIKPGHALICKQLSFDLKCNVTVTVADFKQIRQDKYDEI
jgi:hypothetical protein